MVITKSFLQLSGVFWGIVFLSLGCVIVREGDFHFRDTEPTQESALRTDGYYYSVYRDTSGSATSFYIDPILLWKDGTAMVSSRVWSVRENGTVGAAKERLENSIDNVISRNKRSLSSWGNFHIYKDSLSIKVMRYESGLSFIIAQMIPVEYSANILNDTTFVVNKRVEFKGPNEGAYEYETKYYFSPLDEDEKPSSDNWTQTHPELQ